MTAAVEPTWTAKLPVLSQPVVTGDVALVLASSGTDGDSSNPDAALGSGIQVVALDVETGAPLWRKPFNGIDFDEDTVLEPLVVKDDDGRELVVIRGPRRLLPIAGHRSVTASYTPLQSVIPRTGKVVGERGVSGIFGSCPDGHGVCVDGAYHFSGDPNGPNGIGPVTGGEPPTRWDPAHPRREPESLGGPDATFRLDDSGLYATRLGPPRVLRLAGGQQQWSLPMTEVVGPQYSTDQGWNWRHDPRSDTFVGTLGYTFSDRVYARYRAGKPVTWDLGEPHKLVGLSGDTGQRAWRIDADPGCAMVRRRAEDQWAACVYEGTMTERSGKKSTLHDAGLRVIGYDPATGTETWSVATDRSTATASLRGDPTVMAPDGVVVGTTEGTVAINLSNGQTAPIGADVVTWCTGEVRQVGVPQRSVGPLFFTCTAQGKRTAASVSRWGLTALEDHDGWRLVSVKGRVMAYQSPSAH